jgi:hypothetical protein
MVSLGVNSIPSPSDIKVIGPLWQVRENSLTSNEYDGFLGQAVVNLYFKQKFDMIRNRTFIYLDESGEVKKGVVGSNVELVGLHEYNNSIFVLNYE